MNNEDKKSDKPLVHVPLSAVCIMQFVIAVLATSGEIENVSWVVMLSPIIALFLYVVSAYLILAAVALLPIVLWGVSSVYWKWWLWWQGVKLKMEINRETKKRVAAENERGKERRQDRRDTTGTADR